MEVDGDMAGRGLSLIISEHWSEHGWSPCPLHGGTPAVGCGVSADMRGHTGAATRCHATMGLANREQVSGHGCSHERAARSA